MFYGLGHDFLVFHKFANWLWVRQFQWCQSALHHLPFWRSLQKHLVHSLALTRRLVMGECVRLAATLSQLRTGRASFSAAMLVFTVDFIFLRTISVPYRQHTVGGDWCK